MFVLLLSQLPLPIVLYLNWRVTVKFLRVHRLSRAVPVEKPRRLFVGWWLSNLAVIFVLIPIISERRLFIQDLRWLWSFAMSAGLTIIGLALMNSALGEELRHLTRKQRLKPSGKLVDSKAPDTL